MREHEQQCSCIVERMTEMMSGLKVDCYKCTSWEIVLQITQLYVNGTQAS